MNPLHAAALSRAPLATFAMIGLALLTLLSGCNKIDDRRIEDEQIVLSEVRSLIVKQSAGKGATEVILLDARRPSVIARGSIPGSQPIDLLAIDSVNKRLDPKIAKFEIKVVYGDNPADGIARAVAKKMLEADYKNVRWYRGGWEEWIRTVGTGAAPGAPTTPAPTPGATGAPDPAR
jgi:rhodanese-related sulfurtransferase